MRLLGIGTISTLGRGLEALERGLKGSWQPPSTGADIPAYEIPAEALVDKAVLRPARRADRFTKMGMVAAWDAVQDSGIDIQGSTSVGIIMATAFGPHVTTFRFLDDIIDYGHAGASPTVFSHSVHAAAASYMASLLELRGPTLNLTQFHFAFQEALLVAEGWLEQGLCNHVLVGTIDECGPAMNYICSQQLRPAEDGRIKPFNFSPKPCAVPGEGSTFFLLSDQVDGGYCDIRATRQESEKKADILMLDANGMAHDETIYRDAIEPGTPTASYTPIFGSIMTGSAFHCATGALMLKGQRVYACPVQDNPHKLPLCTATESCVLQSIRCTKYDCSRQRADVWLMR